MDSIGTSLYYSLVRKAQGGNQAAFLQLVHAHDQSVLRLAFRITGSQSDAQDIYQEAFLKVHEKLGGFRFECTVSTWIYRIVTNVCLDHLRRNRSRGEDSAIELNVDNLLNQVSDDRRGNNPEQQLLRRELRARIARALQRLTPRERLVFELKHFQGLKLRTVGEILNCSEPAIKTGFFRATKKLRFQLARYMKGNKSLMKQGRDQGLNQAPILQKAKSLWPVTTLSVTLKPPMSERRPAIGPTNLCGDEACL
jgi:RNA polymerase sigma-70 factor (ECF subfamily)